MNSISGLMVGADPEVMLVDRDSHAPVSAEGKIGGTKDVPLPMQGLEDGFYVQEDNVAAEFNIPPTSDRQTFVNHVSKGLSYVRKLARQKNLNVAVVSTMHFPQEMLETPHAKLLGCDPDINIWTMRPNPRPIPPKSLRTAAGHVHVGWDGPKLDQQQAVIKLLDIFLGMPSLLVTDRNERRGLYGRAGAARIKWYGVEYRTPDNFWVESRAWSAHVFDSVEKVIQLINESRELLIEEVDSHAEAIQDIINHHDVDGALRFMDMFSVVPFPVRAHANK